MDVTINLIDAIPYLRAYHGQTFVVKAGGDLLNQPSWRAGLARDLTAMHRLGIRVVFVHVFVLIFCFAQSPGCRPCRFPVAWPLFPCWLLLLLLSFMLWFCH